MKKWGFFSLILIAIGVWAIDEKGYLKKAAGVEIVKEIAEANGKEQSVPIDQFEIYQGNLLLVNSDYPLNEKTDVPDAQRISGNHELTHGFGLLNDDIRLSESLVRKFSAMIEAAADDGAQHFIISSGFRDAHEQARLYQEKGDSVALPAGNSEHQLGLSLDVGSSTGTMNEAREGKWIEDNAWKYGFVLRYPKDKTHITKIQYEPWHIRYVGLPHSAIMKEKNFVLEEYLAYLKEEERVSLRVEDKQYTVFYQPVSGDSSIMVPENAVYEISGNNMDGIIVTIQES